MPSLATCLAKAGAAFSQEDRAALMLAAQEFRRKGMDSASAERAALEQLDATLAGSLADAEALFAGGKVEMTAAEIDAETPQKPGLDPAADPLVQQVAQQFPDLQVMLDGMDKPMPLVEFLNGVKAEADDLAADAPLMQVAAECLLVNGV